MKRIGVREDKKTLTSNERERGDGRYREGAYGLEHFQEIAAVGEIQNPKTGNFYLEVYSNEYENETPHVALELPQKPNILLAAKIEIKPEQPGPDDEPHFIWVRDTFTISTMLKKEIQKWFVTPGEDGLTGWDKAQMYWEAQAKSVSWGQIEKDVEFCPDCCAPAAGHALDVYIQNKIEKLMEDQHDEYRPWLTELLQKGLYEKLYSMLTAGVTYIEMEQYAEAIADFQKAAERNPGKGWYHYWLGVAYEKMGDAAKAAGSYRKAIEKGDEDARDALERLLAGVLR